MKKKIKSFLRKLIGFSPSDIILNQKKIINNQYITNALANGSLSSSARHIDETNPLSWEFSSFSQNGEDGIIDFLTKKIKTPNKYFVEVGASNGLENNSAYLAYVQKFSGLMIDGSEQLINFAKTIDHNLGVHYHSSFIYLNNIEEIKQLSLFDNPDLFSWDTDGNDYFFVKKTFDVGFRPKIYVVEYNSAFGPHNKITIKYNDNFNFIEAHSSQLYYGCSIALWKQLFTEKNYSFVTVDSNGVNAFFIDNTQFDTDFIKNIKAVEFIENFYQLKKFRFNWEKQFELIKDMSFYNEL